MRKNGLKHKKTRTTSLSQNKCITRPCKYAKDLLNEWRAGERWCGTKLKEKLETHRYAKKFTSKVYEKKSGKYMNSVYGREDETKLKRKTWDEMKQN